MINIISHTAYRGHQAYASCIMHYALRVPASHGGSTPKAMQQRIMHYYIMHYEKVNCSTELAI